MRRRPNPFAEIWKFLVFAVTLRLIAKHFGRRRLYLAGRR
jgi:hypothetical protein